MTFPVTYIASKTGCLAFCSCHFINSNLDTNNDIKVSVPV